MKKRHTSPYRICEKAAAILAALMMIILSTALVSAEPFVIKDGETFDADGAGTQIVQRDRSKQDGTLIYSMTPVYPEDIKEGTYKVRAVSSSQFFRITDAEITVSGGRMTADITISSTSYAYVYQGSAADAETAGESGWIKGDESTGFSRFTIEAEALNKEMPCAAFSKKKQKWYDRDIVFLAEDLPEDALLIELAEGGGTIADTQEAAVKVIYIAFGIIIIGGILNHFVKKRFYE